MEMTSEIRNQRSETTEPVFAQQIGDEFIQLRASGFDLSALDLALISKWYEWGVPLAIPLRVIADVKEYRELKRPTLRVRTLSYVQEEVEAQFAELVEGHVGCGGCQQSYCANRRVA
jgi:hypothetical protein